MSDAGGSLERQPSKSRGDPPTVAGLKLRWHEFEAAPGCRDEGGTVDRALVGQQARSFGMWVLADPNVLLDLITPEEYTATDDRMPYFGEIWPSAESLVAHVLAGPRLDGIELLDLGCGLGPCGFAAAARGAHVTFMDWEARALEIVRRSVVAQGRRLTDFAFVVADWRKPPSMGPFDRVLGADVLYEERNAPAVAAFLAAHLKPGAEAWITDPDRPHARRFPELAQQHGLRHAESATLPTMNHGITITLNRFRSGNNAAAS
ncbi:MAG: methyltransferase domain-containing protein [Planctomycetes bacterium]|nr:methyltransferase domain-containing protein [Planctomycetota bacterium]